MRTLGATLAGRRFSPADNSWYCWEFDRITKYPALCTEGTRRYTTRNGDYVLRGRRQYENGWVRS